MRRSFDRCLAALLGVIFGLTGCATTGRPVSEMTALEVRSIQTRDYEVKERKVLIQAVINHLQDDGYIIKESNGDLGFLSARKEEDFNAKRSRSPTPAQVILGTTLVIAAVAAIIILAKHEAPDPHWHPYGGPPVIIPSGAPIPQDRIRITECTVTVTPTGDRMRLRVNFQEEVQNDIGAISQAMPVRDEQVYQNFFAQVDKSLFLERETASVSSPAVANN